MRLILSLTLITGVPYMSFHFYFWTVRVKIQTRHCNLRRLSRVCSVWLSPKNNRTLCVIVLTSLISFYIPQVRLSLRWKCKVQTNICSSIFIKFWNGFRFPLILINYERRCILTMIDHVEVNKTNTNSLYAGVFSFVGVIFSSKTTFKVILQENYHRQDWT